MAGLLDILSGAEPDAVWTGGGIAPASMRGEPKDEQNPLMGLLGLLASLNQRPKNSVAPPDGGLMQPGSPLAGLLGSANAAPAPMATGAEPSEVWLPPSTNDPEAREPEVFKGGVPLPRPKPVSPAAAPGVVQTGAEPSEVSAPLSLAPQARDARAQAGQAVPTESGSGFGDIMGRMFNPQSAPLWLALGGGFAGAPSWATGLRRGATAAAPAAAFMSSQNEKKGSQRATYEALVAAGVPKGQAIAAMNNPTLLKELADRYIGKGKLINVNGVLVRENPDGTTTKVADYTEDKTTPKLSDGYQWKDPQDRSKGQTHIIGGVADPKVKALAARQSEPPKYEWVDPDDHSKGQRAIVGGGAERVDANVAARIGLAKSFLGQLPSIRKRIAEGEVTGAWDATLAKIGTGGPGEIRRQIDSGAEALLRNLTGAGMNHDEAVDYVRRYKVTPIDTVWSLKSKMDQLERELNATIEEVERGRGGAKPNRSVGGGATSGKTGGGVSWSVE